MNKYKMYTTDFGPMFHLATDECIGRSLDVYGHWALDEIALMQTLLLPNSRGSFLDLGANIGTHSIAIARLFPGINVHSFEAQLGIFQILASNVMINGLSNVISHYNLVGSKTELVKVRPYSPIPGNMGAVGFEFVTNNDGETLTHLMASVAVDDMIPRGEPVALLKVDLEGMELIALEGLQRIFTQDRPIIYFEHNDRSIDNSLFSYFHSRNYNLYWHVNYPFFSENSKHSNIDIFGGSVEVSIVGVPNDKVDSHPVLRDFLPVNIDINQRIKHYSEINASLRKHLRNTMPDISLHNTLDKTLKDTTAAFTALVEDRVKAQAIMENQLSKITDLQNKITALQGALDRIDGGR